MKKLETAFDNLFQTISRILMSFIKHLAKFIVPIPPSYYWMQAVAESSGNVWVGIFAAAVLEIGGMLAAHFAIAFYGTTKGKLAAFLTVLYLIIGIGVMWRLESAATDAKLIVTAIFIIAGMVYILSGMYEIENQEREQIEKDRDWEREQVEKDRELDRRLKIADKKLRHEERLAKIEAKATIVPAQSQHQISTEPAQEQFECEDCNRSFGTVQALNAHGRFCKGIVEQNGKL